MHASSQKENPSFPDSFSSTSSEDSSSSDDDLAVGMGSSISLEEASNGVLWARDDRCYLCGKTLGRVRGTHRHHCRHCGKSVCNFHSLHRRLVPHIGTYTRMCDPCASEVVAEPLKTEAKTCISLLQAQLSALLIDTKRKSDLLQKQKSSIAQKKTQIAKEKKTAETEIKRLMTNIQGVEDRDLKFKAKLQRLRLDAESHLASRDSLFLELQKKKSEFDVLKDSEIAPLSKCVKFLKLAIKSNHRDLRSSVSKSKVRNYHCKRCRPLPYLERSVTESTESRTSHLPQNRSCAGKCLLM